MKGGTNDWEELSQWRDSIPSANFVAIHQQDWEANILWDKVENRGVKLRELRSEEEFSEGSIEVESESDEDMIYSRIGQKTSRQSQRNPLGMSNEPERSVLQEWNRPVTVEPLSRPHLKSSEDAETALEHRHPQMLRLESLSIDTTLPDIEGKGEGDTSDLGSRLNKLSMTCSQKNRELASGSWLDNVLWDHDSPSGDLNCERPKFIYDLQDGEMVFEIPNNKWGQTLRVHAAAVVLSPTGGKDGGVEGGEVVMHAASSIARFNISNDKYYTNKKTHQQQKSHAKKRAVHGVKVMHSLPAIKLQTMKPKLTKYRLATLLCIGHCQICHLSMRGIKLVCFPLLSTSFDQVRFIFATRSCVLIYELLSVETTKLQPGGVSCSLFFHDLSGYIIKNISSRSESSN